MNANRWDCGLDATGHVCRDPNGSTTVGGGFWPKGTPDQYVFSSGTQVAGVIDPTLTNFPWHGDTTAAFFEDPSGAHENGDQLSLIWQSTSPSDLANWPRDAYVQDTSLYAPVLIGRKNASQEDVWARYWDGNPNLNAGRPHPLGVLVEERGLAWNFPSGNEDIQYWIFTVTNITSQNGKVYAQRPDSDSLVSLGKRFHDGLASTVAIPDTGYAITNVYFAFSMDADVSVAAKQNFTTAFLPFNMGIAFKSNWFAPDFIYPSTIFSPPFAPTVGEVGVKYLKSPLRDPSNPALGQIGLVLYSATTNGGAFGDAADAAQVYRYLSGTLNPALGDQACNYTHKAPGQLPKDYHICYIQKTADDIRLFESSGPFTLKPGQSQTIAVAYIAAAPVDNPAIANRSASLVFPSGGPDAEQPESLAAGIQTLTPLDSIFGALRDSDANLDGKVEQDEIKVVPRSLLGKGLVAQAVFDIKFLLPFPPDAPNFFLLPGDNEVTVVWDRSPSENIPDPYFAVASDPVSKLYDPNYRALDLQGYRLYRGRTSGDLQMIAQFDYAGKEFIDYTAELQYGNCAPELGLNLPANGCPADLAAGHHVPIASPFVQIPPGGRVELATDTIATGNVLVIQADTAVTGGGSGFKPLTNVGVPFAFTDHGVKNGFTYFYTVAAFDLNSVKSTGIGFTSLEGRAPVKTAVPRRGGSNTNATVIKTLLLGDSGIVLDPTTAYPTINATDGTFSGNMPPVNAVSVFPSAVSELVGSGINEKVIIDSVGPGFGPPVALAAGEGKMYLRFIGAKGDTFRATVALPEPDRFAAPTVTAPFNATASVVPYTTDTALGKVFGLNKTFMDTVRIPVTLSGGTTGLLQASPGAAMITGRYGVGSAFNQYLAHSRWFDAGGTEPPNPTIVAVPDSAHNSGKLTGVGRIWSPQAYRDRGTGNAATKINANFRGYSYAQTNWYPADFIVTWNADSSITVRDATHHVLLPNVPNGGSGWGFINIRAFTAAGLGAGDLADGTGNPSVGALTYHHVYGTPPTCYPDWWVINCIRLEAKAQFEPIDFNFDGTADANGIGLMINGEAFIMEMNAIPAAGTKWHLRAVGGDMTATCTPALGAVMTGCNGYTFNGFSPRPPLVPNLGFAFQVTKAYHADTAASGDLAKVHTVPDPYYVTNAFEQSPNSKVLKFVNLPSECIIRIYSLSGILVQMIAVNDPAGGGEAQWNLRNRNNQFVASGVYFYHVEARDGKSKVGRFTIVNFAQ